MMRTVLMTAAVLALSACGEKSQVQGEGRNTPDVASYKGATGPYVAKGWTAGDQRSWENQIRTRGQLQNEYTKVN